MIIITSYQNTPRKSTFVIMLKDIFAIKKSKRPWHLPVIAGIAIGLPILVGYYLDMLQEGKWASLAALVILYINSDNLVRRMMTLIICGFLIIISFTIGTLFSFNPYLAPFFLGLWAAFIHFTLYQLDMDKPPGSFFFIMVASMAISMPFDWTIIPQKIGFVTIGAMISLTIGFVYSLFTLPFRTKIITFSKLRTRPYQTITEALVFGVFIGLSLLIARFLRLDNPYWVPISCMAVMQGVSVKHVWTRSVQRVLGTFMGLAIVWLLLQISTDPLFLCICIMVNQIIIEFLIVRNYGYAVVFITVLTVFLVESEYGSTTEVTSLLTARFFDIVLGSLIGAFGGWILHNRQVHYHSTRQMRRTRNFWYANKQKK